MSFSSQRAYAMMTQETLFLTSNIHRGWEIENARA